MSEIVCITNDIPGFRACTIRDEHQTGCDGWAYRLTEAGHVATGKECTGCLPRPARHGLLCHACYDRLTDALDKIEPWFTALRGVDRAQVRDNAGVRSSKSGPPLPLSPLYLTRDEVQSWQRRYPGDPDLWIASTTGATEAVNFTKVATAAIRAHEHVEAPHKVRRVRCPKCGRINLLWRPPAFYQDRVTITCEAEGCDAELDQPTFEKVSEISTNAHRKQVTA
jgi:hypothetical protein